MKIVLIVFLMVCSCFSKCIHVIVPNLLKTSSTFQNKKVVLSHQPIIHFDALFVS